MNKNVLVYYQSHFYPDGSLCKVTTLKEKCPSLSTVVVGCFHIRDHGTILNDALPDDKKYIPMWDDVATTQKMGVKKMAMIGGFARGSFKRLCGYITPDNKPITTIEDMKTHGRKHFLILAEWLKKYNFDGIDLDIEEEVSLERAVLLIDWIKEYFGDDFIIQMAPVSYAFLEWGNMSGFNYAELEALRGDDIDYYCAQFYCGWGNLLTTELYDQIIKETKFKPSKILAGVLSYPEPQFKSQELLEYRGYLGTEKFAKTARELSQKYPDFAGVFCWEYPLTVPGAAEKQPWLWGQAMHQAMHGKE